MTTGRSNPLMLLCALVVLALGVAGWLSLRGRTPAPAEHAASGAGPATTQEAGRGASVELEAPATSVSNDQPGDEEPSAAPSARSTASTNPAPAETIVITGRVICPPGTPIDETIEVLAFGKRGDEPRRARVERDGTFTLALAKGTRSSRLELEARHLFMRDFASVRIKDGVATSEIVLKPDLGACVLGQMQLPAPGLPTTGVAGSGIHAYGHGIPGAKARESPGAGAPDPSQRSATVDSGLRFELHGLAPELEYDIRCSTNAWRVQPLRHLRLAVGETRVLDVPLSHGVTLRGRVISSGGELPEGVVLRTESRPANEIPSASNESDYDPETEYGYASVEPDGTFEERAVRPGRIALHASAPQRAEELLDLGVLGEGDVREGLEVVLGVGGQIGGRVVWPDGTPAAGAQITLAEGDRDPGFHTFRRLQNDLGAVRTDADGKFMVQGLVKGPFEVSAGANAREAPKKGRGAKWSAKVEGVPIGTLNLELTLQGGATVTGIVVDDTGAPVERYTVRATPKDRALDDSLNVAKSVRSPDGRFELAGLSEGRFILEVSLAKLDPPDPIGITIPGDLGPFTFVARRPSSIAGSVLLPDGSPAARARIYANAEGRIDAGKVRTRSGSDGEFALRSAPTGTVTLYAELAGWANSEFVELKVAPAQAVSGIVLKLRRGSRITGVVHPSRAGEPVADRNVRCNETAGYSHASTSTDAEGRFVLSDLAAGEYDVWLEPSEAELGQLRDAGAPAESSGRFEDLLRRARTRLEEGGEAHVVFGSDQPATVRISGSVRRGDAPAAGVRVRALLVNVESASESALAVTNEDGRYELAVVRPGKYRVEALPRSNASLPSGVERDVPASGLDHVDLALATGRIAGMAHANSQLPGGQIHVLLEKSKTERAWASETEGQWPDATFAFEALPAGKYTIVASVWTADAQGRPLKVFPPSRREVELGEGQELVDLRVEIEER